MNNIQKKSDFLITTAYTATIILLVYFTLKYVFPVITPFVVGFAIALSMRPLVDTLTLKLNIRRKWVSIVVLILFYGTIGVTLFYFSLRLFLAFKELFMNLPKLYVLEIEPAVRLLFTQFQELLSQINPTLISSFKSVSDNLISTLGSLVSNISTTSIMVITNVATSIPGALISFLFTIVASFFFTIDFHEIMHFVGRQLPDEANTIIIAVKDNFFGTILKFVKAYAILMSVTFVELSIGFTILKQPNAIALAALIAMIDILPVLGTGGVVLPWVIIELAKGNYSFALGLFIVYLVVTVVRNVLEPKVVGDSIGLYPLVTLFCMFVGAQMFGVIGLFGLPIAATIIKNLNDKNIIQILK